jgi:hypothetical protein
LSTKGFAILLFDPWGEQEARDRRNAFNIPLLADRLLHAMHWADTEPIFRSACLVPAPAAGPRCSQRRRWARAQALLIVGGEDHEVVDPNR